MPWNLQCSAALSRSGNSNAAAQSFAKCVGIDKRAELLLQGCEPWLVVSPPAQPFPVDGSTDLLRTGCVDRPRIFVKAQTCRVIRQVQVREHATHFPFDRSEEHTSELQSLMRISYAVSCFQK